MAFYFYVVVYDVCVLTPYLTPITKNIGFKSRFLRSGLARPEGYSRNGYAVRLASLRHSRGANYASDFVKRLQGAKE